MPDGEPKFWFPGSAVMYRYVYKVAGKSYVGKRLAFRPKGSYKQQAVVEALEGVAPSKPHRVYYHAKHPQMSVLKPGARLVNYIVLPLTHGTDQRRNLAAVTLRCMA